MACSSAQDPQNKQKVFSVVNLTSTKDCFLYRSANGAKGKPDGVECWIRPGEAANTGTCEGKTQKTGKTYYMINKGNCLLV